MGLSAVNLGLKFLLLDTWDFAERVLLDTSQGRIARPCALVIFTI